MKTIRHLIKLILLASLISGCSPKSPESDGHAPRNVVIGMSPVLPPDQQKTVLDTISWLTHQPNCEVSVYDGLKAEKITEFKVPKVDYFKEAAVAQKIGEPLQKWLAWSRTTGSNSIPELAGSGAVNVPKLLERLAQDHAMAEHLIIIGSPVARFPSQTNYDFALPNFRYPTDGCIRSTSTSPFSCADAQHSLAGTRIYYLFPTINSDVWPSDYEGKLNQFYGKFFTSRSGNLMVFTPDLKTGLNLVTSEGHVPFNEFKLSDADPAGMLDAGPSSVSVVKKPLLGEPSVPTNKTTLASVPLRQAAAPVKSTNAEHIVPNLSAAPTVKSNSTDIAKREPAKALVATITPVATAPSASLWPRNGVVITIRYRCDNVTDVDLYLRPFPNAQEICFRNPDTDLGDYSYHFDDVSCEHVKSIRLPAGCDAHKAVCWLNYHNGCGFTSGRIIISTPGWQKEMTYCICSPQGGDSDYRREFTRKRSNRWLQIDLPDLMANGWTTFR